MAPAAPEAGLDGRAAAVKRGLICVEGAGEGCVNGVYAPVDALPPDAEWTPGPLIWRHAAADWLHITFGSGSWWIGHYCYGVSDYYVTAGGAEDRPPVGDAAVWGWEGAEGDRCTGGGGREPLPRVRWAAVGRHWEEMRDERLAWYVAAQQPLLVEALLGACEAPSAGASLLPRAKRWWRHAEELEGLSSECVTRLCGERGAKHCWGAVVRGALPPQWLGWTGRVADLISHHPCSLFVAGHEGHNAFSRELHDNAQLCPAPRMAMWLWLAFSQRRWQMRGYAGLSAPDLRDLLGPELAGVVEGSVTASVWAGAGGTRTPLHADRVPGLVFQAAGTKRFFLSSPAEIEEAVARGVLPDSVRDEGNTENFCVDGSLDEVHGLEAAFPKGARGAVAELRAGDCLVLPAGLYHDVECAGGGPASMSLTVRFELGG